ncbi:MAG: hypothetical protein H6582_01600 [Crocinitomicaceae bacterium]|nr:hypothetical protein [Crocinitomicaceae bacterium]
MEADPEVSGEGNSYTTEFRQYDPRLGRWKSVDPMVWSFPWQSPYVAFDNNPLYFKDPKGLAAEGSGEGSGGDDKNSDGNEKGSAAADNGNVDKNDGTTVTKNADGSTTVKWETGQYTVTINTTTRSETSGDPIKRYNRVRDKRSKTFEIKNDKRRVRVQNRLDDRLKSIQNSNSYKKAISTIGYDYDPVKKDGNDGLDFASFGSRRTIDIGPPGSRGNQWGTNVVFRDAMGNLQFAQVGFFPTLAGPTFWVAGNPFGQPAGSQIRFDANNNILDNTTADPNTVLLQVPRDFNINTDEIIMPGGIYTFYRSDGTAALMTNTTANPIIIRTVTIEITPSPGAPSYQIYNSSIVNLTFFR